MLMQRCEQLNYQRRNVLRMLDADQRVMRDLELQEELLLQYEAIVEEMHSVTGSAKHTCVQRASELLRRLSAHTRHTASELRQANKRAAPAMLRA